MRIRFQRTGGLTGVQAAADVDTESLPADEAAALRRMVDGAAFFELPSVMRTRAPDPDRFTYKIIVEAEGRRHSVEASESAVPETLRPLVQRLSLIAQSARGRRLERG